jgi:hypothetical protein
VSERPLFSGTEYALLGAIVVLVVVVHMLIHDVADLKQRLDALEAQPPPATLRAP